jgi:DNA invertase Pin-like site-specific DNA recombinase
MADTKIKAVIYARTSSKNQIGNFSLPAQVDKCTAFINSKNWNLINTYIDEAETGLYNDRPQFQKMLKNVLGGEATYIVVDKFNRFARDRHDNIVLKKLLRDKGRDVISVSEPLPDNDALATLTEGLMETIAHFFSLNLATEVEKGMRKSAQMGFMPYRPPIGYLKADGKVIVDPVHGPKITKAFKQFSTGKWTLNSWARYAKKIGFTSTQNNHMGPSRWADIFHNKNYLGLVKFNEDYYTGQHPALVDQKTFNLVQNILAKRNAAHGGHGERQKYLLSSLLKSIPLYRKMSGCTITSKGKKYRYYRATTLDGQHHANAEKIEKFIINYLKKLEVSNQILIKQKLKTNIDYLNGILAITTNVYQLFNALDYDNKKILLRLIFNPGSIRIRQDGSVKSVKTKDGFK